ncbi:hypothetical protein [Ramlibacter sp.]|uniref:DODA-type extradiol aromatic ring-opening family dioxygenase n=1 Tax=Ramlibacter sp. TaxID=1917967 RepID=UPI003D102082
MPLVLGMATSHFPSLFQDTYEGWQYYWRLISSGVPQPPEVEAEDRACVSDWVSRRKVAFARMQDEAAKHRLDALIVVGGDQDEWFAPSHSPALLIYSGKDPVTGFHNIGEADCDPPLKFWEHPDRFGMTVPVDPDLAALLQDGLVDEGFDVSIARAIRPRGRVERRAPHAITRPLPLITPGLDVPIVPLVIRTIEHTPGVLSGTRCLAIGKSLARICERTDKRVGILGSGGMSHDPSGPRSGWVDEPLDRWVLDCIERGRADELAGLFGFRSAANASGTGELRTWLVTAAAMEGADPGIKAQVLDYFPSRKATAGCGFALWSSE